jgi:TPR repeat protein
MHLHGMGTPQSCAIAVRLLKTVAERGEWASILKEAHGDYMRGFDRKALMLYMQAAEEGFEVAQNNAAWLLERISNSAGHSSRARGDASDDSASDLLTDVLPNARARRALALRYWQRAAEQGNAEAQRKVGDYFYYGWSAALLKDDSNKTKSTEATEKTASASESTSSSELSTSSSELPSDPPGSTSSSQPESDGEPSSSDSENNMQSSDDQSSSQESASSFSFSFNFNFDSTSDHSKNTSNDADDKSWVVSDYESAAQAYIAAAEARNAQAMFNVGYDYVFIMILLPL